MPTTLYTEQNMASSDLDDDSLLFEESLNTSNDLFPSDLFDSSSLLKVPQNIGNNNSSSSNNIYNRQSPSSDQSLSPLAYQQNGIYNNHSSFNGEGSNSSRLPSLSPSIQSITLSSLSSSNNGGFSPRSSSSPSSNSNYSFLASDEFLLNGSNNNNMINNNSFDSTELDILFQSEDGKDFLFTGSNNEGQNSTFDGSNQKSSTQQSLFLPNQQINPFSLDNNGNLDFLQSLLNGSDLNSNQQIRDDTYDMLNFDSPFTSTNNNKKSSVSQPMNNFPNNFDFVQQAKAIGNITQNQHLSTKDQLVNQGSNGNQNAHTSQNSEQVFDLASAIIDNGSFSFPQHPTPSKVSMNNNASRSSATKSAKPPKAPKAPAAAKLDTEQPVVGKHNKTERRYRQKVQAAQADLRDAIPALRVLYDTSSEEQKRSTDFRAADGTVDGLGEVTRPNASAKATILIGARMYIELLQKRSAMLQRKVNELETFRMAVTGEDDLRKWQADFNGRESQIQAAAEAAAAAKAEEESVDDEDDEDGEEEEEEQPKRKRTKTTTAPKQPRAKLGPKKKDQKTSLTQNVADSGMRMFAAFAVSFSFLPSASNVLQQTSTGTASNGQIIADGAIGQATTGQILSKLPLITAEHTSRLLARGLPNIIAPSPHTLIDWTWRLLVAVILAVSMGPIIARLTKQDKEKKAGNLSILAKDCLQAVVPFGEKVKKAEEDQAYWSRLAAGTLGGVIKPSTLERWHIILHLHNTASEAYPLTLLALLQHDVPFLRSSQQIWHQAQANISSKTPLPLTTVLKLPLNEALRCAEALDKTSSPIAAIAEQITLVHLYDLYSRFFVKLIDASLGSKSIGAVNASLKNLLGNLESYNIGLSLKLSAFDKEIRTIIESQPKGSAAHALGLVLIGLWGIFVKPTSNAQVALATALAAEEIQGAGEGLSSISSLLELLYPGSTKDVLNTHGLDKSSAESKLPRNALVIDKLALTCIDYLKLLISSNEINGELNNATRLERLEKSKKIQKETSYLRLILTQTKFIGFANFNHHPYDLINDDEEEEEYNDESNDETNDIELRDNQSDLDNESRKFELAKEKLVKILYNIGRKATGRINGRDDDSGLEGDLDEL
ncbi:uncharacterized protein L201_001538 [Kwoniella dendrophila CBS 6074]|uniref:BHLH domain-containing protein n=1 Tax=Kwoniella dendrophila CBS 6074 TaxID=1295534 RepID=A0AAX4JNM0_9TREE